MSAQIFYEDGQGNVVDEHGMPEPMDYVIDGEQCALETVSSYTQYLHNMPRQSDRRPEAIQIENARRDVDLRMKDASAKRAYTLYTDQEKVIFKLMFEKCLSASAAAKLFGIHVRTAQRWAKQYERDPDSIFEKRKKNGRPRILNEEHKKVLLEYMDENPFAVLEQLMKRLSQKFEGLKVSKNTVYNFMRTQCNLSLKKARFQPVERNIAIKVEERYDWVRKWEGTDMDFMTNCVFLDESAFHVSMKRSMAWSKKACLQWSRYPQHERGRLPLGLQMGWAGPNLGPTSTQTRIKSHHIAITEPKRLCGLCEIEHNKTMEKQTGCQRD